MLETKHPACPGANAYVPLLFRENQAQKPIFCLNSCGYLFAFSRSAWGHRTIKSSPGAYTHAWGGHPQNLKVGSFRKNGQNRQASRSGVRVKLSHGAVDSEPAPTGPCGRSSLARPVSSNAMTASSAKRKHATRNRTSISSPVSLVALPACPRLIPGRLFPRPLVLIGFFGRTSSASRAHRLPSPKREKMV